MAFSGELDTLVEAGRRIVAAAGGLCDEVEVFLLRNDSYACEIHGDELRPEVRIGRVKVGIRALRGGALSLASTTSLGVEENVAALRAALAVGKPAGIEGFSLARTAVDHGIDGSLVEWAADPALVQELARTIRRRFVEAPGASRIASFDGSAALELRHRAVVGTRCEGAGSRGALHAYADLEANHYDVVHAPVADEDSIESLGGVGARLVAEYPERDVTPEELGVRGSRVRALLAPRLAESIVRTVLQEKLLASTLAAGNTALQPGQLLWGAGFSLDSLGADRALFGALPCDDEGTPTRRVQVIEGGAFRSFVSSRRSAAAAGVPETGNGLRTPLFDEEPSEALIRDRLAGIEIAAGTRSRDELIGSMERGVVLFSLLGLHGCDRARASFSATSRGGFAVRDGKVIGRLAPGAWSIAGRLLPGAEGAGMLAEVEASREQELTGSGRVPWLLAHGEVG